MKLLIVDDEKGFADALKDNFEFEGYTVDCAYGGVAALDRLKADKYHLVVLDVMMPDLDGFGVLAELRKTDTRTPVIFLTARAEEDDRVNGMCAGADVSDAITAMHDLDSKQYPTVPRDQEIPVQDYSGN